MNTETQIRLTADDLWDLAELAWSHADRNDDDQEYYDRYMALHEKLLKAIELIKTNRGN
jgi:hypothetical protein